MKHPTKQRPTPTTPHHPTKQQDVVHHQESYNGPIPHPSHLSQFEEILPGSAERIFQMTEGDLKHIQDLQKQSMKDDFTYSMTGVLIGGIVTVGAIFGSIYVIIAGHDWAGVGIIGMTLSTIVGAFIYGTNNKKSK